VKLSFVGISGYALPHTRVRCYHFAESLRRKYSLDTEVVSYKDMFAPELTEADMWSLGLKQKISMNLKAYKYLKSEPRVVYLQKIHYHSAATLMLHRLKNLPYIFDYDDYDVDLSVFFQSLLTNYVAFRTPNYLEATRIAAEEAVSCVAASKFLQGFLSRWNKKTFYLQTGVDTDRFVCKDFNSDSNKVRLLWVGLVWGEQIYQNILFLLEAYSRIYSECPNTELVIVGGGQYMKYVNNCLKTVYSNLPVTVHKEVDYADVPGIMQGFDLGMFPLVQRTQWAESKSPTKVFEYLSTGLAVVASRNGEVRHLIDDGKDGYLADNMREFVDKAITLIKDKDLRTEIGKKAAKRVKEEFSLNALDKKLLIVLQESLGKLDPFRIEAV
jgi:glycosyltransferase involved in cell wall biosynthesis